MPRSSRDRETIEGEPVDAGWSDQPGLVGRDGRNPATTGGIVLIALGLFLLMLQFVPGTGNLVVLGLGIAFYLVYFLGRRQRGFLIAGGILSGLGLGVWLQAVLPMPPSARGAVLFVAWAAGFLSIYVADRSQRWVFWPAAVFSTIAVVLGALAYPGAEGVLRVFWPVLLIAIGVWLLLRRYRAY